MKKSKKTGDVDTVKNPMQAGKKAKEQRKELAQKKEVEMQALVKAEVHAPAHASAAADHHETIIAPTKVPQWLLDYVELVFKVQKRNTTVEFEIYCGLIQFISCLYVLPVVPEQLDRIGFNKEASIIVTCITCAIGSIAASFVTDMPFIIAPPTSVSIFYAVSVQQQGFSKTFANGAIILSGAALAIVGAVPPLHRFLIGLIPDCIQASTAVGIGLITALAGATEIHLVVRGKYTILDMGPITDEVVIAMISFIIVAAALHYHFKGAFCCGLFFGTFLWWIIHPEDAPHGFAQAPEPENAGRAFEDSGLGLIVMNLVFLYIITLNGLAKSLSDLAKLTKRNGAIPRAGWLYIICGLTTMLSGFYSGPPILISPESAAGVKAGAKTGLSTLVCGILFGISCFFAPLFEAVPAAGTAPLLLMVGVVLFNNVKRIEWMDFNVSAPAYIILFMIPFTYSILRGVAFGYVVYIILGFMTGDMYKNLIAWIKCFINDPTKVIKDATQLNRPLMQHDHDHDDEHPSDTHIVGRFLALYDMDAGDVHVEHM